MSKESEQIDKLASFIMSEIDGEPSKSEGAIDCAIRLLKEGKDTKLAERKRCAGVVEGLPNPECGCESNFNGCVICIHRAIIQGVKKNILHQINNPESE